MSTSTDLRAAIEEIQDALPADERSGEFDPSNIGPDYQRQALERFARRLGSMPWWMISSITHVVLFLLIAVLAVGTTRPTEEFFFQPDPVRTVPPKPYDEKKPREIFPTPSDARTEETLKAPELPVMPNLPEELRPMPSTPTPTPRQTMDPISEVSMGVNTTMVSNSGPYAGPANFAPIARIRTKRPLGPYGVGTEGVVEAALNWLVRHQEADGSWDPVKHGAEHGSNVRYQVGCTGLALLAFLGHGDTERSGPFRDTVRRAEEWLMKQQKADGGICEKASGGSSVSAGYNHAIAGLALAEAYGMGGDARIGAAAQRAADYSVKVHQESAYSGWRYDPKEAADLSVTGWFVMQLKSARVVGLRVDGAGLNGASAFLDKVFDRDGQGRYLEGRSPSSSMTAVAMVCRQFMGTRADDPTLTKAAGHLMKDLPDWKTATANAGGGGGDKGMYYWYYGTLGMFQMGPDHGWLKWNETLKPVLVGNQRKGGDEDGSWDPQSWIDQYG
ncbi:MAG TPA: terpene cyclase/mutase family protein, partial [Planctomycetota bacterium]|nr:terpene cyclase/mutase family protein [Planctomycetota bacterium]